MTPKKSKLFNSAKFGLTAILPVWNHFKWHKMYESYQWYFNLQKGVKVKRVNYLPHEMALFSWLSRQSRDALKRSNGWNIKIRNTLPFLFLKKPFKGWNSCTLQGPSYYRYDPSNLISNLATSSSELCALTCRRDSSCVYWSYDTTNSKCALLPEGILDNTAQKESNDRIRGDRSCYPTGCNEKLEVANTVTNWDANTFYETGSKVK